MKTIEQIFDEFAANLYLLHWQLGERPTDEEVADNSSRGHLKIPGYIDDQKAKAQQEHIRDTLCLHGYQDPNTTQYDNDSIPFVQWKSKDFDCLTYYHTFHD